MPKTGQRDKSTGAAGASRQSKVTDEHRAEAQRLRQLWEAAENRPTQAKFGEDFEIGNQSAVGQFLRGEVALSLDAACGFALGLRCRVQDFSPRLAARAARVASVVVGSLTPEVAAAAIEIDLLDPVARTDVLEALADIMRLAKPRPAPSSPNEGTRHSHHATRRTMKG